MAKITHDLLDAYGAYCTTKGQEPPDTAEVLRHLIANSSKSVYHALRKAQRTGSVLVQPRCGVGDWASMKALLSALEREGGADILTLTIDAHSRLLQFDKAAEVAAQNPERLNGFPLLWHGWRRTRELCGSFASPVQVRHGSPDARLLFGATLAAGISSFEGGGLTYNIPYSKTTAIIDSLRYWQEVDAYAGQLAQEDVVIDREIFGTLTAVLIPPCIALSVSMIEAMLAARAGVKCISIAFPQTGNLCQDVAALRSIKELSAALLPADVAVFPVLHQFMGAFPKQKCDAEALIVLGSIAARLGQAVKVINKTYQEALGIPTPEANVDGIQLSKTANSWFYELIPLPDAHVQEAQAQIVREVSEILDPVLQADLSPEAISTGFLDGRLDVPFSTNTSLHSAVIPARAASGAIYVSEFGGLAVSERTRAYHRRQLSGAASPHRDPYAVERDVLYFARETRPREGAILSPIS